MTKKQLKALDRRIRQGIQKLSKRCAWTKKYRNDVSSTMPKEWNK